MWRTIRLGLLLTFLVQLPAMAQVKVDLELILMADGSGDGPDRNGLPAAIGRDQAVAQGMTVNGLPILEELLWLDEFFTDNVIGGPGAFSIPARGFKDIYIAIRKKLIREIAGGPGGRPLNAALRDPP